MTIPATEEATEAQRWKQPRKKGALETGLLSGSLCLNRGLQILSLAKPSGAFLYEEFLGSGCFHPNKQTSHLLSLVNIRFLHSRLRRPRGLAPYTGTRSGDTVPRLRSSPLPRRTFTRSHSCCPVPEHLHFPTATSGHFSFLPPHRLFLSLDLPVPDISRRWNHTICAFSFCVWLLSSSLHRDTIFNSRENSGGLGLSPYHATCSPCDLGQPRDSFPTLIPGLWPQCPPL